MSANTLVMTLVSEQTMPNIQFLKWFFGENRQSADILFVSTEKMEAKQKSQHIKNAVERLLQWFSSPVVIKVDENDFEDIKRKISEKATSKAYKRIVADITNGTKLMCLGMYEACKEMPGAEIYYQLLGSNKLQKIFPAQQSYEITDLLTLDEYMKGSGVYCPPGKKPLKDYDFNKSVCEDVINDRRELITKLVTLQKKFENSDIFNKPKSNPKGFIDVSTINEEKLKYKDVKVDRNEFCELIDALGFDYRQFTHAQLRYITGGWFEEFVYQKIKTERNLDAKNIALDVKITKGEGKNAVENELDVVYLDEKNKLHVVECKSFLDMDGDKDSKVLNDALYKLQAIMKARFGLHAASYLYTMSVIESESALNRAKDFEIKIVDGKTLCKECRMATAKIETASDPTLCNGKP